MTDHFDLVERALEACSQHNPDVEEAFVWLSLSHRLPARIVSLTSTVAIVSVAAPHSMLEPTFQIRLQVGSQKRLATIDSVHSSDDGDVRLVLSWVDSADT